MKKYIILSLLFLILTVMCFVVFNKKTQIIDDNYIKENNNTKIDTEVSNNITPYNKIILGWSTDRVISKKLADHEKYILQKYRTKFAEQAGEFYEMSNPCVLKYYNEDIALISCIGKFGLSFSLSVFNLKTNILEDSSIIYSTEESEDYIVFSCPENSKDTSGLCYYKAGDMAINIIPNSSAQLKNKNESYVSGIDMIPVYDFKIFGNKLVAGIYDERYYSSNDSSYKKIRDVEFILP